MDLAFISCRHHPTCELKLLVIWGVGSPGLLEDTSLGKDTVEFCAHFSQRNKVSRSLSLVKDPK